VSAVTHLDGFRGGSSLATWLARIVSCSVFMMRAIEQMSVEETAACLGIPGGTVKTRFHRANKLLRQALTTQFGAVFDDMYLFLGARCDRLVATVLQRIGVSAETGSTVPQCDRPAPCRSPP
jgi:Sigma-70, region 4